MLEYEHTAERFESGETRLVENLDHCFDAQSDGLDTTDVRRVLADSENGVCSCADETEDDPVVTLWS